jgi:hypothetical protein
MKLRVEPDVNEGWSQWLMSVILPIWEAEIRRMEVPGQPRQ